MLFDGCGGGVGPHGGAGEPNGKAQQCAYSAFGVALPCLTCQSGRRAAALKARADDKSVEFAEVLPTSVLLSIALRGSALTPTLGFHPGRAEISYA